VNLSAAQGRNSATIGGRGGSGAGLLGLVLLTRLLLPLIFVDMSTVIELGGIEGLQFIDDRGRGASLCGGRQGERRQASLRVQRGAAAAVPSIV
jgi:hypothetical protein